MQEPDSRTESKILRLIGTMPWPRACAEITSHFGASAGRADARLRDAGDAVTLSRSGNAADPCPALLFAPYMRPGMLVARARPADLGAGSKM